MIGKSHFYILLITLLCCRFSFAGQTNANNWDKLNLDSTTISGAKVYYEKLFEPNLPFFEEKYKETLAQQDKFKELNSKKDEILKDINSIIGITEPDTKMQEEFWKRFTSGFPTAENMTFYLVKQSTVKDFLRSGGTLPDFTYNKETDTSEYKPGFSRSSAQGETKKLDELAFLVESAETFEDNVSVIFQIFNGGFGKIFQGTIIHEITEVSLLRHIRQTDQYWRWFTDGFSEAITYEILKNHFNNEDAREYLKGREIEKFAKLKKEVNLNYWLSARFEILHDAVPIEQDSDFMLARYAYATYEARRLVEKHGIECIKNILDEITKKDSRNGSDLLETIKNVTGEDMNARLAAYQSFETKEKGIEKYATAFNEASDKKDYEQMLFNLFRMHELRSLSDVVSLLEDFRYAGSLLFKMGLEQQADIAMQNCFEFFSNPGYTNGKKAASEVFMVYALETEKPLKAQGIAEELLKTEPDNISALTIKMFVYLSQKDLSQAKETAERITELSENENSMNYKIAAQVISLDPNAVRQSQ